MATVTFSKGWLADFYNRQESSNGDWNFTEYNTYESLYLKLMSGTIPTDFSTLTSPADLIGQTLWKKQLTYGDIDKNYTTHGDQTLSSSFEINMNNYQSARLSGTVEWFWLYQTTLASGDDGSGSIHWQMLGSVGTSGTDLILPTTSIVNSKSYRIRGLGFQLNQDYTY